MSVDRYVIFWVDGFLRKSRLMIKIQIVLPSQIAPPSPGSLVRVYSPSQTSHE